MSKPSPNAVLVAGSNEALIAAREFWERVFIASIQSGAGPGTADKAMDLWEREWTRADEP